MMINHFSIPDCYQRCQVGLSAVLLVVVDHFAQFQSHEELVVLFGYFREQVVPVSVSDRVECLVSIDFVESVIAGQFVFVSEFVWVVGMVGFNCLKEPCPVGIEYHCESELDPALEPTFVRGVWFLRQCECHCTSLSWFPNRIFTRHA
jgi:hypothetical protein